MFLKQGIEYAKNSKKFKTISLLSFLYFFFSAGLWSVIPYLAKYVLHYDAKIQGAMVGMIGIGSISTGILFPYVRNKWDVNKIIPFLFFLSGLSIAGVLIIKNQALILFLLLMIFGFSWASAVSLFNAEIQSLAAYSIHSATPFHGFRHP